EPKSLSSHTLELRARICLSAFFDAATGTSNTPMTFRNPSPHRISRRCWNINQLPISYASLPRLRGRLTLRRLTLRRKPWTYGEGAFHPLYRYSCQHSHFRYLQHSSRNTFTGLRNALLPCVLKYTSAASVYGLAPLHLPRRTTRSVSYYAFFKGWLLLSQPPDCLCLPTSFPT